MNTKQCKGCKHWRRMSGLNCNACHYRLDTDESAKKDADGKCLCYAPRTKRRGKTVWREYPTGASPLTGYAMN